MYLFNSQGPLEGSPLSVYTLLHPNSTKENSLFHISFHIPTKRISTSVLFPHFCICVIFTSSFSTKIPSTQKLRVVNKVKVQADKREILQILQDKIIFKHKLYFLNTYISLPNLTASLWQLFPGKRKLQGLIICYYDLSSMRESQQCLTQ